MSTKITINDYLAELTMTRQRRLLVEGKNDKVAIGKLLTKYFQVRKINDWGKKLQVDSAERINEPGIYSKRITVESVYKNVQGQTYENKLVVLVDRELREFEWNSGLLSDNLGKHNLDGRLIWTRGHSIENYLFDEQILDESVFSLTSIVHTEAMQLLSSIFAEAIYMACAISLAANEIGKIYRIKKVFERVSNSILEVTVKSLNPIEFDSSTWQGSLENRFGSTEAVKHFMEDFNNRLPGVRASSYVTARWMCHGHVGMAVISRVYAACVAQVDANASGKQRQVLNGLNETNFAVLASHWARLAIEAGIEHPSELFDLLSIS